MQTPLLGEAGSRRHDLCYFRTHVDANVPEYTLRTPSFAYSKVSWKSEMKAC
jgi:hypothetical protein